MNKIVNCVSIILIIIILNACSGEKNSTQPTISPIETVVEQMKATILAGSITPISVGTTLKKDGVGEFTLLSVLVFDRLKFGDYDYSPKEGIKRIVVLFDGMNLSNEEQGLSDKMKVTVLYDDKYEYETSTDFDFIVEQGMYSMLPLQKSKVLAVIEVPDQVAIDLPKVLIKIKFDYQIYTYQGGIENVIDYSRTMQIQNDRLNEVQSELSSLVFDLQLFSVSPTKEEFARIINGFITQELVVKDILLVVEQTPPPAIYIDGHTLYKDGIRLLDDSLILLSIRDIQDDLSIYGPVFEDAGTKMTEAGEKIEQGTELLGFLN